MRLRKARKPVKTVVRPRLMELLAEHNLELARAGKRLVTLTDVARDTDVSYTTIVALAQNKVKTLSFDMMARLMDYFNLSSFDELFIRVTCEAENGEDAKS